MIKTYVPRVGEKITEEQRAEVQNAKKYPLVFDEDCPELSPEMLKALKCSAANRNRRKA